jgi:Na+/citrate or Na+/malate symporter
MIDWLFRNRQTGEITIAQAPNIPLIVFMVAVTVRWVLHPHGTAGTIVSVVATVALLGWAVDEIIRGVNPWRRFLGGGVLAFTLVGLLLR